uniref:Protein XRI1 n=1 Tax=Oryza punctata TaxID=4537 RepID=A0A0E0M1V8_ORYPU
MEAAAQETELQLQGVSWPFHTMEAASSSWDASSSSSSGASGGGGDCFLLGWEPPFAGCLGVLADVHGLFPLFGELIRALAWSADMESPPVSLPPAPPQQQQQEAVALPEELDDLLLNFWDASSEQQQQQQVAFNSICVLQEKTSSATATATTTTSNSNFFYDDDDLLGSIFSTGPTLPEKGMAEPLLSSSSSSCQADPQVSEVSGAQTQATPAPGGARAPPPRCSSSSSSLKRAAPADNTAADAEYCSQSSSKRRRETETKTTTTPEKAAPAPASACRVLCPFAVLKPDGLDGGATLADINARILMRPSRPVRHPVGEFACAPRVSADKPGLSGKTVSGFTRLHTPGRGTITIIRTRG